MFLYCRRFLFVCLFFLSNKNECTHLETLIPWGSGRLLIPLVCSLFVWFNV